MFNEETRRRGLGIENSQALAIKSREEVRAEGGLRNLKTNHSPSLEESSTATIDVKKDISKGIVRLGITETRKIRGIRT